ncbi:hypothetical protein QZH41_019829 [Actinostola sp. cb2023]|nr:hypothetical protein QZH41_019829 [Actinostola sp. cb2023]
MEKPPSEFEKKVSTGRKQVMGYWGSVKNIFGRGQSLVQTANVKTSEFMELISTDQTFQIKVAAISTGVLVGAIAAGRGRKYDIRRPFRRIFYSAGLGSIAFSICYPQKAWHISQKGYETSKGLFEKLKTMYDEQKQHHQTIEEDKPETTVPIEQELFEEPPEPLPVVEVNVEPKEAPLTPKEGVTEAKEMGTSSFTSALDFKENERSYMSYIPFLGWFFKNKQSTDSSDVVMSVSSETSKVEVQPTQSAVESSDKAETKQEVVGDHGQSNPADKDMYSTRE